MFIGRLKEIWAYRDLISAFVVRDLKVRYRGSVLGFLWSFLDPLVNMLVLWVVFGFLFARGIENFAIFLLIGILPWGFFSGSVSQGSAVISESRGLIKKIRLPREVFPISIVIANLVHFFFALVILVFFLVAAGVPFSPLALLFFPVVLLLAIVFNLGVTFITSSISVYFKDFPFIVESFLRIFYFATPIFYSVTMIPEKFRDFFLLNPLASMVTAYRQILMEGRVPELSLLVLFGLAAFLVLSLGWFVFVRLEKGFAEEV